MKELVRCSEMAYAALKCDAHGMNYLIVLAEMCHQPR